MVAWLVPLETAAVWHKFCVHHATMHQFTVSLFKATYVGRMGVELHPVTCTFGRMTVIINVLLW